MNDTHKFSQLNNRLIAKNTVFLYIRMLFIMAVTLYTSRVVLAILGIEDFGIFNAVGGIVAMMGFLNSAMANAVQRFLSFELGRNNHKRVNLIFNVSLQAHFIIAFIVFIVMEIAGIWFLNTQMNIPADRMDAAMWVFQCSVVVALFSILQVPYNAMILAYEQMRIYAFISIIEVILKLAIVYVLMIGAFDKLILYSILTMVVTIIIMSVYTIYCIKNYPSSKIHYIKDISALRELTGFAGWNMLGEIAWIFTGQGVNLLLNIFFGPVVNAARGIAFQVEAAVIKFITSFQMALNPQIIKTYAANEHLNTIQLVFRGTRFSFYLLLLLSLPLIFEMHYILGLWLKEVPPLTAIFTQLILVCSLCQCLSSLFATVAKAYGKIRNYQVIISIILFLNFPLSYIVLKLGYSPQSTVCVAICIQLLALVVRLLLAKKMITYSISLFISKVLLPLVLITTLACIVPLLVHANFDESFIRFLTTIFCTDVVLLLLIYTFGLESNEKKIFKQYIQKIKVCLIKGKQQQ